LRSEATEILVYFPAERPPENRVHVLAQVRASARGRNGATACANQEHGEARKTGLEVGHDPADISRMVGAKAEFVIRFLPWRLR